MLKVWLVFCGLAFFCYINPSPGFAQEVSSEVKKNVVKSYKSNLSDYLPFGTSNCSLKSKGDANCDGAINRFDLSIWEVEFNTPNNPKRSDFNNDGVINLLDFGIWSGNNPPQIDSSQVFISGSGNSLIVNKSSNGSIQQVNFDTNANPASSQLFNSSGLVLASISFLSSGANIQTQELGVQIQTSRAFSGAVFQSFRNPDGSLITLKSWPTQASYESGEPPSSVTLPGRDNKTLLTLNIQPNNGGILNETDLNGKILNQTQLLANGLYSSTNTQSNATTQSIIIAGFTNLTMPNSLGGTTTYYFINSALVLISQTDSKGNSWIAVTKGSPDTWELLTVVNGQESKTIVSDPIKAINSNTPSPKHLVDQWSYYSQAAKNQNPDIDFAASFNSNANTLASQVQKADQVYSINLVQPQVLGIVKEVRAQQKGSVNKDSNEPSNNNWVQDKYTLPDGSVVQIDTNGIGTQVTIHENSSAGVATKPVGLFGDAERIDLGGRPDFEKITGSIDQDVQAKAAGAWADSLKNGQTPEQAESAAKAAAAPPAAPDAPAQQPLSPAEPGQLAPPEAPIGGPTTPNSQDGSNAALNTMGLTSSPPAGFDPVTGVGPSGSLNDINFSQAYDRATGDITATAPGNFTAVTHQDGTMSWSYEGDSFYSGTSVAIGADGSLTGFSNAQGSYTIEGNTVIGTEGRVSDQNILDQANSLISVNNDANGRYQGGVGDGQGTTSGAGAPPDAPGGSGGGGSNPDQSAQESLDPGNASGQDSDNDGIDNAVDSDDEDSDNDGENDANESDENNPDG